MSKYAIVSGASGGIGRDIVKALLENEYQVFGLVRNIQSFSKLESSLPEKLRINLKAIFSELMNYKDIEHAILKSDCDLSKVDTLINSVGLANEMSNFQVMDPDEINDLLRVNLNSVLFLTRIILPKMLETSRGHIINLGSVAAHWASPRNSVYSVAKSGIHSFTESLRLDLMGTPIRVTNIEPGLVNTEFVRQRFSSAEKADHFFRGVNMLEPSDVAETVMWCLNRPDRVNIQEIVMFSSDQAGVGYVSKSKT